MSTGFELRSIAQEVALPPATALGLPSWALTTGGPDPCEPPLREVPAVVVF